jgi:hypothetical protein
MKDINQWARTVIKKPLLNGYHHNLISIRTRQRTALENLISLRHVKLSHKEVDQFAVECMHIETSIVHSSRPTARWIKSVGGETRAVNMQFADA